MVDVGLGQLVTATGRRREKVAKKANIDNIPVLRHMEEVGGIIRVSGGRTYVTEAFTDQNDTVNWVGPRGQASLNENNILDAAQFNWFYLLGSAVFDLGEQYQNEGEQYIPLIKSKFKALETTQRNKLHEGILSNGTGVGGLQIAGLASHVSTTPTTGTVGGIDRSSANAAWFRNDKFDSAADWSDGAVDSGNATRFFDQMIDATMVDSIEPGYQLGLVGSTHWGFLTSALRSHVQIVHDKDSAKFGHNRIWYRGIPMYLSGGLNVSGFTAQTATRTYMLNVEEGGFNVIFHKKAEFSMLEPVPSADQAMISRLMLTMVTCSIGGHANRCSVGFD